MRALTVWQPYASRIAAGEKLIENRPWRTRYRGPLLIHAGTNRSHLTDAGDYPLGVIVALVDLLDVHEAGDGCGWACAHGGLEPPTLHWLLARPRPLPHVAARGMPGLWHPRWNYSPS